MSPNVLHLPTARARQDINLFPRQRTPSPHQEITPTAAQFGFRNFRSASSNKPVLPHLKHSVLTLHPAGMQGDGGDRFSVLLAPAREGFVVRQDGRRARFVRVTRQRPGTPGWVCRPSIRSDIFFLVFLLLSKVLRLVTPCKIYIVLSPPDPSFGQKHGHLEV